MKKENLLPAVAWLGGLGGFALRRWELAAAYDPELKLMHAGCPATWLLWVVAVLLAGVFVLACRGMSKQEHTPKDWFYAPSTGYLTVTVCAGFLLLAGGALLLWQQSGLGQKSVLMLVTGGVCMCAGPTVLAAGRSAFRGLWSEKTPILHMMPAFGMLFWLVVSYQGHARQPEIGLFMWQMLAGVSMVLALYGLVTLAVGKGGAGKSCVFCLLAISLSVTTLADGHTLACVLLYAFVLLYLTAQSRMLLQAAFGEPRPGRMPCGAEEEEQTEPEE